MLKGGAEPWRWRIMVVPNRVGLRVNGSDVGPIGAAFIWLKTSPNNGRVPQQEGRALSLQVALRCYPR